MSISSFYTINTKFNCIYDDLEKINTLYIQSKVKNYSVEYSTDNLTQLLSNIYNPGDFIIIDKNVFYMHSNNRLNDNMKYYCFDALEPNKTMESVLNIIDILIKIEFSKSNKLIVIGGGITQDVGGFVASMYKRGTSWVFIPTTLLAMVDSCIGGKVCLNRGVKNILSVFYSPDIIYISDDFLRTLSWNDILSGIGEAFKISIIGGDESFRRFHLYYEKRQYINIIKLSNYIKQIIVENDEFDMRNRKVLNYGHTFGHAIESASLYFIPHGIAVLFGMYIINRLFYRNLHKEINDFILNIIPDCYKNIHISYQTISEYIKQDKKNISGKIGFIVLYNIGNTDLTYKNIESIDQEIKIILSELFDLSP